jgi:hypothetical protein
MSAYVSIRWIYIDESLTCDELVCYISALTRLAASVCGLKLLATSVSGLTQSSMGSSPVCVASQPVEQGAVYAYVC